MNTIQPQEPLNPAAAGTPSKSGAVSSSRETQASARKQSLDASITTTDGDSFVLSAERVTATAGITYSASSPGGKAQLVAQSNAEASLSASRVTVALSGDIDTEEARDIAGALRQLLKALKATEKGHLAQAAHRIEKLAQLDSIAKASSSATASMVRETTVSLGGE